MILYKKSRFVVFILSYIEDGGEFCVVYLRMDIGWWGYCCFVVVIIGLKSRGRKKLKNFVGVFYGFSFDLNYF